MKEKNYKLRSKILRFTGIGFIGLTTLSAFLFHQMLIDWSGFEEDINNFMVIQEESLKLNATLAFPFLIGIVVFLYVMMKKNRDFFKERMSVNILFTLFLFYLIYSVIEITIVTLIGAWVGTTIDEFVFLPLSKLNALKSEENKEISKEYSKEQQRILARRKAESDLNGSV